MTEFLGDILETALTRDGETNAKSSSRGQNADREREIYLGELSRQGVTLKRVVNTREVIYRTISGKTVRLPFANQKSKGNEWFWGLPHDVEFDIVVLLARTDAGALLDFIIPASFLTSVWDSLHKDKKDQVKFEVFFDRGHGDYQLVLKKGRLRRISGFLGRIDLLA
jgi:hypothetical protein